MTDGQKSVLETLPEPKSDEGAWLEVARVGVKQTAPGVVINLRTGLQAESWGVLLAHTAFDAARHAGADVDVRRVALVAICRAFGETLEGLTAEGVKPTTRVH
jgi:hypothetical protein